jgi:hypothetical protein
MMYRRHRSEIDSICAALQNDGIQTVCIARDIEQWGEIVLSPEDLMQTPLVVLCC